MPNTIDIYQPRYLAEVVRSAPPVHTFLRDTFFTNIKTFATEEVDIDIVKQGCADRNGTVGPERSGHPRYAGRLGG